MAKSVPFVGACVMAIALLACPGRAEAAPGEGRRLGGAEPQGPATESVTGLHHNPALLARMPGLQAMAMTRAGLDHLSVRRFSVSPLGAPDGSLGSATPVLNPSGGYFAGASFRLDPIAIGAGVYMLDGQTRLRSDDALAYHLAGDPDFGCTGNTCPAQRIGGQVDMRTDFTVAIAWNIRDRVQLGGSFHFPRARLRLARNEDTRLASPDDELEPCGGLDADVEDPRCAERLAFTGRTQLRLFGLNPDATRFDFALTLGIAFDVNDRLTLGARFRTRPLLNAGRIRHTGSAVVCLPTPTTDEDGDPISDVPSCEAAAPVTATVVEELHRELAIGASVVLGQARRVELDANFVWSDLCPGGLSIAECSNRDARTLELVGLDADAAILPETPIYRGRADRFATELWGRYHLRARAAPTGPLDVKRTRTATNIDLLLGGSMASPAVRPGAITAADNDAWELGASLGAAFELPRKRGSLFLVPGYALDFSLPVTVGPGGRVALYDPGAAIDFEGSGGDINAASASAVLAGRGRPTNAGRYWSALHMLSFAVRWSERAVDVQ